MKDFEVWKGSPPLQWDELVCRCNGTVFHSSLWAEYQSKIQNSCPYFLLTRNETGEEGSGTVALFRKSELPIVSTYNRELVLLTHPFMCKENEQASQKFFDHCEKLGQEWGCSRITIESFGSGGSPFVPVEHGYQESRRVEFFLDLRRDRTSLWEGIKKDQRERIRRLEREGVVCIKGTDLEDLKGLKMVRETTQEKRAQKGQNYSLSSDDKVYEYLDRYVMKRGIGRVFLAKREDEILAAIFYATFNGKAYSVFSGSTVAGYRLSAQSGLYWEAVKQFQAEGFRELNRGGVPESASVQNDPLHGIYQFKKRLGTTPLTCRSGVKVLSPVKEKVSRILERMRALR